MRINAATVKAVAAIASKDGTREVLTGALLDPETGTVTVTDSYRLITARAVERENETEQAVILSPRTVKDLTTNKREPFNTTITDAGDGYATAEDINSGQKVTAPTIKGSYPNYKNLITEHLTSRPLTSSITVNAKMLSEVLAAMHKAGADNVVIVTGAWDRPFLVVPAKTDGMAALVMPARGVDVKPAGAGWAYGHTPEQRDEVNIATNAANIAHAIATVTALTAKAGE